MVSDYHKVSDYHDFLSRKISSIFINAAYSGRGIIEIKTENLLNAFECALSRKIRALQGDETVPFATRFGLAR